MTAAILALLTPFVLVGMLIVLDKLCGVIAAEVRRARMRARTKRSLRERARRNIVANGKAERVFAEP